MNSEIPSIYRKLNGQGNKRRNAQPERIMNERFPSTKVEAILLKGKFAHMFLNHYCYITLKSKAIGLE
jgi:hypothetical protein